MKKKDYVYDISYIWLTCTLKSVVFLTSAFKGVVWAFSVFAVEFFRFIASVSAFVLTVTNHQLGNALSVGAREMSSVTSTITRHSLTKNVNRRKGKMKIQLITISSHLIMRVYVKCPV